MPIEIIQGGPYRLESVPNKTSQNMIRGEGQGLNQADNAQNIRLNRNRPAVEHVTLNRTPQPGDVTRQNERTELNAQIGRQEPPIRSILRENREANQTTPVQNPREEVKRVEKVDVARVESQNIIRQQASTTGVGGRITIANQAVQVGGRINLTA